MLLDASSLVAVLPAVVAAVAALVPASLHARDYYVDTAGNTPYVEIQAAIDAGASGDVVHVFPGTYGPVDFGGKDITLRSVEGPSLTVIDAGGSGPAVTFNATEGAGALLHGFTLTGGTGREEESIQLVAGGGIFVGRGATPRISGNVITGNSAEVGAGIASVSSTPSIYGNTILSNIASVTGGGLWLHDADGTGSEVLVACNAILGNEGGQAGGILLGAGSFSVRNNTVVGNVGERGGLWALVASDGNVDNNTLVANDGSASGAGGLETESATLAFRNNLVAYGASGWGAIRASADAVWSYNVLWSNAAGEYSGAAGDPTGTEGNLSVEPSFVSFTLGDATDDDLSLVAGSPLLDLGDPSAAYNDLDGSRNSVGAEGGPQTGCDGDADGERPSDALGDCLPDQGEFHPLAYELDEGLDANCDGWATLAAADFVLDDGSLTGDSSALWAFGAPTVLPGEGYQGVEAWCTAVGADAPAESAAQLDWAVDLSSLPIDTGLQLSMVHAYDSPEGLTGGIVQSEVGASIETLSPIGGYPTALTDASSSHPLAGLAASGLFSGDSQGWTTSSFSIEDLSGTAAVLRFHYGSGESASGSGWTLGRLEVAVVDEDGDGRGASVTDCDDSDATRYNGAPEVPYDGIDQDCDGADLEDVDEDGYLGTAVGGDDCLDTDPQSYPGASEQAYDGIDQDCDGSDLTDVDGDGSDAAEAGGGDCDDSDAGAHPDAAEVPYDGVDQDCDGSDLTDVDGDGYDGEAAGGGDCDDSDAAIHPLAWDACDNGIDEDCDGTADVHPDHDGDGYDLCAGDCNEGSDAVFPGAPEACDGLDTDCDGNLPADENDADEDGQMPCAGDCADDDDERGLAFQEICDAQDNDCDGEVDEGHDLDGDGFSSCGDDCDDQLVTFSPEAEPDCQSILDHDCNGSPDVEQDECAQALACAGCQSELGSSGAERGGPEVLLVLALSSVGMRRRRRSSLAP